MAPLRIRWFASLVDHTGVSAERIEVSSGQTVEQIWDDCVRRYPGLADLSFRPAAALDLEYASWSAELDGVEELAFLPPVSGG